MPWSAGVCVCGGGGGGLIIQRHNEIRDLEAEMLRMVSSHSTITTTKADNLRLPLVGSAR